MGGMRMRMEPRTPPSPTTPHPGAPRLPLGRRQVRAVSVDPDVALAYKFPEVSFAYDERNVALYALGMGACGVDG
ncbi:uncharacterized protein [Aegilops tauschii subsp. strangulata]|uniref:Uncharacterized protein n=2 Tax=Aegilops tauschii subsp. strangulata TaxID=200361 RepID=A0A453QPS5_AEGTS